MNYQQALEYIHGVNWSSHAPTLERITELCQKLNNPQKELRFIHIAGTNGKGSTASMLDSILRSAGYKTGLFTSPYIRSFNERMRINGENISDGDLAKITGYIRPIAETMKEKPTEFELITAIAMEYFKRNECDVVVLEAGMGGRLDSTNVIEKPLLSIITGISLDHTAFLGDTIAEIAAEKAGIIKRKCPILFGGESKEADGVISKQAEKMSAPYSRVDYSTLKIKSYGLDGTEFSFEDRKDIKISLLGSYQPRNAACVLKAVDILREEGLDLPEKSVEQGLSKAKWQARFELLSKEPTVIFDGAHNPEGVEAAVESIKACFRGRKVCVLSGVLKDKAYDKIAEDIAKVASFVFTVTPESPRALPAKEYAEVLNGKGVCATPFENVGDAVEKALEQAKKEDSPLICMGSLYLYSSIIDFFEQKNDKILRDGDQMRNTV